MRLSDSLFTCDGPSRLIESLPVTAFAVRTSGMSAARALVVRQRHSLAAKVALLATAHVGENKNVWIESTKTAFSVRNSVFRALENSSSSICC